VCSYACLGVLLVECTICWSFALECCLRVHFVVAVVLARVRSFRRCGVIQFGIPGYVYAKIVFAAAAAYTSGVAATILFATSHLNQACFAVLCVCMSILSVV